MQLKTAKSEFGWYPHAQGGNVFRSSGVALTRTHAYSLVHPSPLTPPETASGGGYLPRAFGGGLHGTSPAPLHPAVELVLPEDVERHQRRAVLDRQPHLAGGTQTRGTRHWLRNEGAVGISRERFDQLIWYVLKRSSSFRCSVEGVRRIFGNLDDGVIVFEAAVDNLE